MRSTRIALLLTLGVGGTVAITGADARAMAHAREHVPAHASTVAPDTIRGIVFDSLMFEPIARATVVSEPIGAQAMTDEQGRFTLISGQPITRVAVFHDMLDRTGIGSLSAEIGPTTNRAHLVLSTPSLATIWPRLCPGVPVVAGNSGIVFGTARKSGGSTRVAGARVRVSWNVTPTRDSATNRSLEGKTDATGTYYVCGVPTVSDVYVIGYSPELASGALALPADSTPLRRQDLTLAATGETGTVRGVVRDSRRAPVANAIIDVDGFDASVKTDASGRFQLSGVPAGSRTMLVRAVGFSPMMMPVEISEPAGDLVNVNLERTVFLPGVKVTERTSVPKLLAEFEERKRLGFGVFLDSVAVKQKPTTKSLFEGIQGVRVQGQTVSDLTIFMSATTGYCTPTIFLDGFKADTKVLMAMNKESFVAVEVYLRSTQAPAKYIAMGSTCGVVLVWTKSAFAQ
jgi:hypothetical protein